MVKLKSLLISLLISLGTGALSGFITRDATRELFTKINQPSFAPPAWVFPVVWTILFTLMGVSAYLIYEEKECANRKLALSVYVTQLIFNFLWSIIFFVFEQLLFAFVWIILLWILIILMIILFSKCNKLAAYLQIPYLLWVTFAAVLNLFIVILN